MKLEVEPYLLVPNNKLSLAEGAIRPWSSMSGNIQDSQMPELVEISKKYGFSVDTPIKDLNKKQQGALFYGDREMGGEYEGVANNLLRRYKETESDYIRGEIEKYMRKKECSDCQGKRLKKEVLSIKIGEKNISDVAQMDLPKMLEFLANLKLAARAKQIAEPLVKEIKERVGVLINIGLDYLTLDRSAVTLSGGEAAKIRVSTQITLICLEFCMYLMSHL